jgi:uncharacterized protein DUF4193
VTKNEVEEEEEEEYQPDLDEDEENSDREAEAEEPEQGDASLDEIYAKKPEERAAAEEEEDEESILALGRDERVESLSVKVVPPDPNKEFTCRKCYLVKHRSQLADKKRMYCRDCV